MVAVLSYMIMHHIKCFNSKSFFFFKYLQQVFQTYYSQESCWNCPSPWGLRLSPFDPSSTPISRFPCSLFISPFLFSSITPVRAQFSFLLSRGRNFHSLFIFILFCYIGSSIPFPSRSSSTLTSLLSFSRMLFSFFFFLLLYHYCFCLFILRHIGFFLFRIHIFFSRNELFKCNTQTFFPLIASSQYK